MGETLCDSFSLAIHAESEICGWSPRAPDKNMKLHLLIIEAGHAKFSFDKHSKNRLDEFIRIMRSLREILDAQH